MSPVTSDPSHPVDAEIVLRTRYGGLVKWGKPEYKARFLLCKLNLISDVQSSACYPCSSPSAILTRDRKSVV